MMKLSTAFFIAISALMLSAVNTYATETCAADVSTCTPKQICDAATSIEKSQKVWSLDPASAKHVALSKQLGINCGVTEVIEPTCETDAEHCAISALCEQATLTSGLTKAWSTGEGKTDHVRLAKEYGLKCDVIESQPAQECTLVSATACTDKQICSLMNVFKATDHEQVYVTEANRRSLICATSAFQQNKICGSETLTACTDEQICTLQQSNYLAKISKIYQDESKKRGLACGIAVAETNKLCSIETLTVCSDTQICTLSSMKSASLKKVAEIYIAEAEKRNLPCQTNETHDLPLCSGNGIWDNCFGTRTDTDGDQFIGLYKDDWATGVITLINNANDQWKGDVRIGFSVNGKWSGNGVYIWHTGEARFEWNWKESETYNSNSTINEVFPSLTRLFNNLSKQERIAIQRSLAKKGLYGSTIDGGWGRNTLIAIGRFSAEHLNSINLKATENVELVLDSIIEQGSLARTKMALPAVLDVVAKRDVDASKFVANSDNMKDEYKSSSSLKRKQIQYALKQLGYYSSSIDGLWGDGTSSAMMDYVQSNGISGDSPSEVYSKILSSVDVPNSFDAPKVKVSQVETNAYGLSPIISNPSVSAAQAYAICKPQAQNAKRQASQASEMGSSSIYCDTFGSRTTCDAGISGGVWGGIAAGLDSVISGKGAYESVMSSCLAHYGWQE